MSNTKRPGEKYGVQTMVCAEQKKLLLAKAPVGGDRDYKAVERLEVSLHWKSRTQDLMCLDGRR